MRPAGVVMVLLFCVCALVLALLQQIQRFLNIGHCALRQSDHLLIDDLEVDRALVEQVVDLLVVDLQVGDVEPSRLALSSGLREDLLQREEDESFGLAVAQHRVGLAGGGLAVHEDGGVTALKELFYHPGAAAGIDLCVALGIPEDVIAGELVDVVHFYLAFLAGRVLGGLGPERMPGEGGDLLLLLVDAPGLDVLVLVDEGPEPDCNLYLLAALLHLTTNNCAIVQLQLMAEERYVFVVEWFDSAASLVRSYQLTYFLKDRSIEMFDLKNKRIFLKRCEYPQLQLKDIFVGAVLSIYSRQLKVIDFADEFTRTKFEVQRSKALLLVTPDAYLSAGKILNAVEEAGFSLTNLKMARLGRNEAEQVLEAHRGRPYFAELAALLASDLVLALEVLAENCVAKVKDFVGSVRQKFGTDQAHPAIIGSESTASAAKELEIFFSAKSQLQSPAYFTNCSCLVVKPHLVTENYVGQVLDAVLSSGFEVSAAEMFWLDRPSAEEFLEVYKGVVPEYSQLVEELTNGPCIAMEVRQENVVPALRELCGPHDPEMAKTVRPKSLRAVFGRDKGKNGVHCTDLPDDGILEVEYFFNILQKK